MKEEIKNKKIPVQLLVNTINGPQIVKGTAIVTNDKYGKTLSLIYGSYHIAITFEQVEKYLKD